MDTIDDLLRQSLELHGAAGNPRQVQVIQSLIRHLFAFASEVRLTREEWQAGLRFLNQVGQTSHGERDEFMLLSDVLGLSSLMDVLHQPAGSTEGTVLGPFYLPDSPRRERGASLIDQPDGGETLTVSGTVRSTTGTPLAGALVDVWSCASNGLYAAQDPSQPRTNMRGVVAADADGSFCFDVVRPTNYSVPTDGPAGAFLRLMQRDSQRAAHVHLIISAPGHDAVTTHLFDSACPYLQSDAVFSVRKSLVTRLEPAGERHVRARFDVTLHPTVSTPAL